MKKQLLIIAIAFFFSSEAFAQLPFIGSTVVKTMNCYEDDSLEVSIATLVGDYGTGQTQYETDVVCFSNKTDRVLHVTYLVEGRLSSSSIRFTYEYSIRLNPKESLSDLVQSHYGDQRYLHDTDCKAKFQLKEYHSTHIDGQVE